MIGNQCQELRNDSEEEAKLTLPDGRHLRPQQNLVFEVDDLALVRVYNL